MKKVLLIGASGGIGNKVAEELLEAGYSVIGTYFQNQDKLGNLKSVKNFKGEQLDIKEIISIRRLREKIKEQGRLYGIVNCEGIVRYEGEGLEKDLSIWNETIATNLSGNYFVAKIFDDLIVGGGALS